MTIKDFAGHSPSIADTAFIDDRAYVSGEVVIGAESSMWPMSVARGDMNKITIGVRTNIQDGAVLHGTHQSQFFEGRPLAIGDEVTVGHNVTLHACQVGNLCLVGMGSTVLDGAVLADEVMLGAGSVVPPGKRLDSGLWLGNPAKRIRDLTRQEKEFLRYSADNYARLAKTTKRAS